MTPPNLKPVDFDHPSIGFILEDKLKNLLGGPLMYDSYYKTFGLRGDETVLDFGCGGGIGSKRLARLLNDKGRLTCVDTSKTWINKARTRLKNVPHAETLLGDIRRLKLPEASFDIVTMIHVLHDIVPEDRDGILQALACILKNGGLLFIREPTRESHGIPVEEIRNRLQQASLKESEFKIRKSEYRGKFMKL